MHIVHGYPQLFTKRKRSKKRKEPPTAGLFFSSNGNGNDHLKSGQLWSYKPGAPQNPREIETSAYELLLSPIMNVLFVYLDKNSSEPPRIAPGIAFLSGHLKRHGTDTRLCYLADASDDAHCISVINEWHPQIIAISSVTSGFPGARHIISLIREQCPSNPYIICGGPHVSLFPEELHLTPGIDAICRGYGEEALLELVRTMERGSIDYGIRGLYFKVGDRFFKNGIRDFPKALDDYFPEDREIFYAEFKRKRLALPFSSSTFEDFIFCRGCPFDCSFCSNHRLRSLGIGRYLTYPEVHTCIGSIRHALTLRQFNGVNFHDDIFTLNKRWLAAFLRAYRSQIGLPFGCNVKIGTFTDADIKLLKESGCTSIVVGIESGNEYIRRNILNKGRESNSDIVAGFRLIHKHGIPTASQNMIGLPQEDFHKFYDTVIVNAAILPNIPTMSVFSPYPGTDLYERAKNEGLLESDPSHNKPEFVERINSLLRIKNFPRELIEFYAKNFRQMVLLEYLFGRLRGGDQLRHQFYKNRMLQQLAFGVLSICLRLLRCLMRLRRRLSLRRTR